MAAVTPEAAAQILGIPLSSTRDAIAAAYRRRARATHPDRRDDVTASGVRAAGREFVLATEAKDVLWEYADTARDRDAPPEPARSAPRMTFDQFLEWREDAAWGPTPRSDPRADPAMRRSERWPGEAAARDAGSRFIGMLRRLQSRLLGIFTSARRS